MPRLAEIVEVMEGIAPSHWAEEWDNPGLQVGSLSQEVKKILLSLDPGLDSLRSAEEKGAQMLFTHHPLILEPLKRIDKDDFSGHVIYEAVQKGIAIFSAHTNLDVAEGGINDILASLLGLKGTQALKPLDHEPGKRLGLGRVGDLPEPMSLSDMARRVQMVLGSDKVRLIGGRDKKIERVAVVGGAGGSLVREASQRGADLLVTGDVSYHNAQEAAYRGLAVIDAGHFHTEKVPFDAFSKTLGKAFEGLGLEVGLETWNGEEDPSSRL